LGLDNNILENLNFNGNFFEYLLDYFTYH